MREDENGNIILEDGTIIPSDARTPGEVYSRVVGFIRPVAQWNDGKREEFVERATFDEVVKEGAK